MFVITESSGSYDSSYTSVIGIVFSAEKAQEICNIKSKENQKDREFKKELNSFLNCFREKHNVIKYYQEQKVDNLLQLFDEHKDEVIDFYKRYGKDVKFNTSIELFVVKSTPEYDYEYEEVPVLDI
jgi:hypothetical protein